MSWNIPLSETTASEVRQQLEAARDDLLERTARADAARSEALGLEDGDEMPQTFGEADKEDMAAAIAFAADAAGRLNEDRVTVNMSGHRRRGDTDPSTLFVTMQGANAQKE